MKLKALICTAFFAITCSVTSFGAENTAQVVSFSEESDGMAVELTGSKVITEDFSYKLPRDFGRSCVIVPDSRSQEIYDKEAYEEDGSGLLFTISCYEDVDYRSLAGCDVLGFCGNKTYILERNYIDFFEDSDCEESKACDEASRQLKKSFVALVSEGSDQ